MALDVKVKIDINKPAGNSSFGYPLIINVGESEIAYTECRNVEEVATAGFAATTDTYKAAAIMFGQDNPPGKIAVCQVTGTIVDGLGAIRDKEFRQIMTVGTLGESETTESVAAYVETTIKDKMYFATVASVDDLSDIGSYDRTVYFVHTNPLAVAALIGESAGRTVGSFTYKNLILKSISPMKLTDSEIAAIHTAKGITFVTKAGDNVTTEGKVVSGEYIDIIDCKDYIISNLEYQTQKALNNSAKIPYDNSGIAMLENVAVNVLRSAYNLGMIATDEEGKPMYSVDYAMRSETTEEDRTERKYVGGKFSFTLGAAIHTVDIVGEIII